MRHCIKIYRHDNVDIEPLNMPDAELGWGPRTWWHRCQPQGTGDTSRKYITRQWNRCYAMLLLAYGVFSAHTETASLGQVLQK